MARTFHLTIAKIGENLFDGEALSATLPGTEGVFTILAGHEAFVSTLKSGAITVIDAAGQPQRIEVSESGVAEVSKNQATVLL